MDSLTTVKPYSNEIHAQAQLWLKRDPKAAYEVWKKCLPARGTLPPRTPFLASSPSREREGRGCSALRGTATPPCSSLPGLLCRLSGLEANGKSPSRTELRHLYLTEKYAWKWKQYMSKRGKRTCPLDLKLGHNNWLRQVRHTDARTGGGRRRGRCRGRKRRRGRRWRRWRSGRRRRKREGKRKKKGRRWRRGGGEEEGEVGRGGEEGRRKEKKEKK